MTPGIQRQQHAADRSVIDRQLVGRQDLSFRQDGPAQQPGRAMLGPPGHLHGAAHLNSSPEERVRVGKNDCVWSQNFC